MSHVDIGRFLFDPHRLRHFPQMVEQFGGRYEKEIVMKKIIFVSLLVIVIAAVFVVPVFAQGSEPPAPSPLVLPDALTGLIALGIGFLVTQGMKAISQKFGSDLSGYAAMITAGLVTSVVAFGNSLLSLVPAAYTEPVSIVLTLIVSLFGVFGLHYSYSALKGRK
jgi:hypothetical protein